jgi:hypothetical protein
LDDGIGPRLSCEGAEKSLMRVVSIRTVLILEVFSLNHSPSNNNNNNNNNNNLAFCPKQVGVG